MPGLERPEGQEGPRTFQIFKCHPSTSYCFVALVLLQRIFILAVTEKKRKYQRLEYQIFDLFHMKSNRVATIK